MPEALAAGGAGPLFLNEPLLEFFANRKAQAHQAAGRRETMVAHAMAGRPSLAVGAITSKADVTRAASLLPSSAVSVEEDAEEIIDGSSSTFASSGAADDGSSSTGSVESAGESSSSPATEEEEDESSLPMALQGGKEQEGVGDLLGHALAALYVARHGLTVTELMHLLATLREREDRRLCTRLWERREALLAAFSEAGEGKLAFPAFDAILRQQGVDMKPHDLVRLLDAARALAPGDGRVVLCDPLLEHCCAEQQRQQQQEDAPGGGGGGSGADRTGTPFPAKPGPAAGQHEPREARRAVPHPLGAEMESALLQMLEALGVLGVHGGSALVLPLEAEALRETIRVRYIEAGVGADVAVGAGAGAGAGAGGEELWHGAIIHYFQSQPSGLLRRCEELPWHLQVCRHWLALRDFLVDLRAFRAMYGGRLKGELFEYWRLLTEGPLVLPGTPAAVLAEGGGLLEGMPALAVSL